MPTEAEIEAARCVIRDRIRAYWEAEPAEAEQMIDGYKAMAKAALEAAEVARGTIFLEANDGWYAISTSNPKFCLFAATLERVQGAEQRARQYAASLPIKSGDGNGGRN